MKNQIIYVGTEQSTADLYKMIQKLAASRPLHLSMHRDMPDVQRMMPVLRALPEYQLANNLLITDDGIASALSDKFAADQKKCYFMEPRDGYVVSTLPMLLPGLDLATYRSRLFKRLPKFDLFITGCYGVTNSFARTGAVNLVMAVKELQQAGRYTVKTCSVVLVNSLQDGPKGPNLRLIRPNIVINHGYSMHRNKHEALQSGK